MEKHRKRALEVLQGASGSASVAASLEAIIDRQCTSSDFPKAVRRVVALLRRVHTSAESLPEDEEAMAAFVGRALAPPVDACMASKRPRRIQVIASTEPVPVTPPMPEDAHKVARYIPGVMDGSTCAELISRTEGTIGYREATLSVAGGGSVSRPDIRDNDTCILTDEGLASSIWAQVRLHLPEHVDGKRAVGLNPRLRFYRYSTGQSFSKHTDGASVIDGQQSLWTILVYLNEGFGGGSTRLCVFDDRLVDRSIDVRPATGAAFVFDHSLLHASTPITSGVKYAVRSDVMFTCGTVPGTRLTPSWHETDSS